jgi:hypothetical protein
VRQVLSLTAKNQANLRLSKAAELFFADPGFWPVHPLQMLAVVFIMRPHDILKRF